MKKRRHPVGIIVVAASAVVILIVMTLADFGPRASGALRHDAYVWQRIWTDDVPGAVDRASGRVGQLCVLTAEVSWEDGDLRVVRIEIDYEHLQRASPVVGLALRIGPYGGPFAESGEPVDSLAALANERVEQALAQGVAPSELQLDFDCAESNLDGYARWVGAIRRRIAPTPLTITVLPSWLDSAAFRPLVAATEGYVLQVHSLERPRGPDEPMTLCNPRAARRAVERAGRVGTPFRVALPTYGYFVGFDANGKLLGLQAEGPSLAWPPDATVRSLRADPQALAELVRSWTADRPAAMQGVIWYRLPTDRDVLNWRWATFASVMEGRSPRGEITVRPVRPEAGLVDVELVNLGDADAPLPRSIDISWKIARLVASDALGGYALEIETGPAARLRAGGDTLQWISAGEIRKLAWFRFDTDTEVEIHVTPGDP